MLEVEPTGPRGPMATGTGRNGIDLERFTSSISRKRKHIRATVTIKHEQEIIGCLSFAIINGIV